LIIFFYKFFFLTYDEINELMIFRAIILSKNQRFDLQTDEIIAKLSLIKFVLIKKRNVDFSYAATDNINALLDLYALIILKNYH
jgi:hypothetical protein